VALITDDLAGHTRQAEAIVAAISDAMPITMTCLTSKGWTPFRSWSLRKLLAATHATYVLPLLVRGNWRTPFDVIVSASSTTVTANILLKRKNRAISIFSGPAPRARPGDIDCIIAHQQMHVKTPNHILGSVPVLRIRAKERQRSLRHLRGAQIGVLLGGRASRIGYDFSDDYCRVLFDRLMAVDKAVPDIRWVIVTAKRTPPKAYDDIARFAASVAHSEIVDFRNGGLGSIARAYDCDAALVTEDTKTTIMEFARNGIPTAVLEVPRTVKKTQHEYYDRLKASGEVPFLNPAEIDAASLENALCAIVVEPHDVYVQTRALISQRISGLFPS
jgi:mitochondrial fission protein ELM1